MPHVDMLDARLAQVSEAVFARVPAAVRRRVDADGAATNSAHDPEDHTDALDWASVSAALRELHVSAQDEFTAMRAQVEALDAHTQEQLLLLKASNENDSVGACAVDAQTAEVHAEVNALLRELGDSEHHFRDVAALVAPAQRKLEALEARAAYFRAALEVERLSQRARAEAVQATRRALDAFQAFTAFVATLPVEYSHIHSIAERRIAGLTRDLKTFALEKLQQTLDAIAWPAELSAEDLKTKLSQESAASASEARVPSRELWAIETLLQALEVRFQYHFERTASPTNRLAKPEWVLSHVLTQVHAHAPFLHSVLTPELEKQPAALPCCDAQVLLLRGLIRLVQRKLRKDLPSLIAHKALFCHTLDEVLLFEQTIDDAFAYASYADSHDRAVFPRCIDVFTDDMAVFIAWTHVDVEYAMHMFAHTIFPDDGAKAWTIRLDDTTDGLLGDRSAVPRSALDFASLLDFMCRRFVFMASDEHRFLYLTHVHHVLLRAMLRECERRARAINIHGSANVVAAVADVCVVVNALESIVELLAAWEQSSIFLELTKKVVQSNASRSHVLQIHLAYSKSVLQSAAQAASNAVLTREEAVAVRHAIAGPGSLIGPTAAFSAAYSVGSKTMRSLLGRGDAASESSGPSDGDKTAAQRSEAKQRADAEEAAAKAAAAAREEEERIFARSIFERQIGEFRALSQRLLQSVVDVVGGAWRREMKLYTQSLLGDASSTSALLPQDVSPAIGASFALLDRVLAVARESLSVDSRSHLVKSIASALDELVLDAVVTASGACSLQSAGVWTPHARAQFALDVSVLLTVLERCAARSKRHVRKLVDLTHLFALEPSRVRAIQSALCASDGRSVSAELEQVTTMLEVCRISALTPEQVLAVCEQMVL